jgi:hypothetical protein
LDPLVVSGRYIRQTSSVQEKLSLCMVSKNTSIFEMIC